MRGRAEADFTLSSADVGEGQIRRLVGVSEPGGGAPALLALNTANQVLVNWSRCPNATGTLSPQRLTQGGLLPSFPDRC
jgi:hypothetical protein